MRDLASVAAIGLLGVIAMTSAGCLLDYEPPPKPVGNWTVEQARRFNEFQVYWLGESYRGLPLTSMRLTSDGDGVTHTTFSYGEPSLAGSPHSQDWVPPLEVDIQPYCGFPPEEFLSSAGKYVESDISGVQIRGVDGYLERYSSDVASLFLWTGGSTVHLYAWKTELDIEEAARELIPIAGGAGAPPPPFPPPITTSCR
jgi:hypothetical protein